MRTAEQYAEMAEENAFVSPETAQVYATLAVASATEDLLSQRDRQHEEMLGAMNRG